MLALLVPQVPSSRRCLYMTDLGALDVRHRGLLPVGRDSLPLLPEGFIVISTLYVCCAPLAACCWCKVSCCLFLMRKMFFLLKYNQSRITQARDKQVEEIQDQSMKGCSHKELDKENCQQ